MLDGAREVVHNMRISAGEGKDFDNRNNSISGANEAVTNRSSRAGGGGGGREAIKTVSEFQKSPLSFSSLNRYIFVCQMESHSGCTVHTLTCLSVDLLLYLYPLCVDSMLF